MKAFTPQEIKKKVSSLLVKTWMVGWDNAVSGSEQKTVVADQKKDICKKQVTIDSLESQVQQLEKEMEDFREESKQLLESTRLSLDESVIAARKEGHDEGFRLGQEKGYEEGFYVFLALTMLSSLPICFRRNFWRDISERRLS